LVSLTHLLYALFAGHGFSGALPGAGVALGLLAAHRQTAPVPKPSVADYITQTCYILCDLSAQPALDNAITVDNLGYPAQFIFAQLARTHVIVNLGFLQDISGRMFTYTVDIRQGIQYRLIARYVNTNYTRHNKSSLN